MDGVMIFKSNDFIPSTGCANYYSTSSAADVASSFSSVIFSNDIPSENGKYSIIDVANWFLSKSDMTQKKLQKLCYYAQAWCYALNNFRLVDSDFQAWVHGPVSPVLYEKFKSYGYDAISIKNKENFKTKISADDQLLLEKVWATYGEYDGNALEALTHHETPWIQARDGYAPDERCTIVISPDLMKSYYLSIYEK